VLVPIAKVQILGRRAALEAVLERLYGLQRVQLVDVRAEPDAGVDPAPEEPATTARQQELAQVASRVEAMLGLVAASDPPASGVEPVPRPGRADLDALRRELDRDAPAVQALTRRADELRDELAVLPRYLRPLEQLVPLVPELAALTDAELRRLGLHTIALVLNTTDETLVHTLRDGLSRELGPRFELVSTAVDHEAIGCLLVLPSALAERMQGLLAQERVRHLPLPDAYTGLSLHGASEAIRARLEEAPAQIAAAVASLEARLRPHEAGWRAALAGIRAELEQLRAAAGVGVSERVFAAVAWVPRPELGRLGEELEDPALGPLVVEELEHDPRAPSTPVLMRERRRSRPFGFLTRLFDTPRASSLDPTGLMALFLPLMFGVMVGDLVYGALLLALGVVVRRRFASRSPVVADLSSVLIAGALWAVAFGALFGEALGGLGKHVFGDFSLWFYRGSADALEPLLLFSLAIGAAHITLGLLLGLWQSWGDRDRGVLLDRAGTLVFLIGLFALAGYSAGALPDGTMTPPVAAMLVGLVLVMCFQGALGLIMGPLELLGTIGNLLSYLRLAAVGLASVYLAVVANELATVGPLWLGLIVAAFFHALNLALASFSPLIQSLRLHYVEFFSKFFVGGGRAFRPFGDPDPQEGA
jgi:V/A-type H+/Na+-transporting ATPase subunit I